MRINDTQNEDGLFQEIDSICNSTSTSYPVKAKARRVNNALDKYFALALQSSGNWKFGDLNRTDLPAATADLKAGQKDYSFDSTMLGVDGVFVLSSGNYVPLKVLSTRPTSTQTGTPTSYFKEENSIILFPIPATNVTNGLQVVFRRAFVHITSTDTTQELGIPSVHQPYIARQAALPYLIEMGKKHKDDVANQIVLDENDIKDFYTDRSRDEVSVIQPNINDYH